MSEDYGFQRICSVTEMAKKLGLSRARFYQLQKMGLKVSHKQVMEAIQSPYPEGLTEDLVDGTTLYSLFQYLERNR